MVLGFTGIGDWPPAPNDVIIDGEDGGNDQGGNGDDGGHGDGYCDSEFPFYEDSACCPEDCGSGGGAVCGDEICEGIEDPSWCPEDCS